MRLFIFAAVLALASARYFEANPQLSLDVVERDAGPADIPGIWKLAEATADFEGCPQEVNHTTWGALPDGTIGSAHNTIVQDGDRCESIGKEKALRFFLSQDYDADFNTVTDGAPDFPEEFKGVLTSTGPNINIRGASDTVGEPYLLGYEAASRFCGGSSAFQSLTSAFVIRPFTPFRIANVETELRPGKRYLIMVPRFSGAICVYSIAFATGAPGESPGPNATDEAPAGGATPPTSPGASPTPGSSPTATPEVDSTVPLGSDDEDLEPSQSPEDGVCFPGDAQVEMADGTVKQMRDVSVGDVVKVDGGVSKVFAFTHKDADVLYDFVGISAADRVLEATASHFVYVKDGVKPAGRVVEGDVMFVDGREVVVDGVSRVTKSGLFNPQTESGDILVNGFKATTYTTTIDLRTAHAALAPFRAVSNVFGVDGITTWAGENARWVVSMLPVGSA